MRNEDKPLGHVPPMLCNMRGYTILELVVAMSLASILTAIAIPRWNAQKLQIQTAHRQVLAVLRLSRGSAITKSVHYQVSFPNLTHITISRMIENPAGSGTWAVDSSEVRTQVLPGQTTLKSTAVGKLVEFNTRGLAITNTLPIPSGAQSPQVAIQDSFGVVRVVEVWPSGQINAQ